MQTIYIALFTRPFTRMGSLGSSGHMVGIPPWSNPMHNRDMIHSSVDLMPHLLRHERITPGPRDGATTPIEKRPRKGAPALEDVLVMELFRRVLEHPTVAQWRIDAGRIMVTINSHNAIL